MKKLLFLFSLLISVCSFATHNMAGNITYRYIGNLSNPYKYEIKVTTYTKWVGSSSTDKCELNVHFGDGDTAIAPRVNGSSVNCPSAADGVLIMSNVRMNVYLTTHDYAGPGNYIISMSDPNRSSGICNVSSSDNVSYYLEAELVINPFLGNNSGPDYTAVPVITVGSCCISYYNPLTVDADGDSLYYEFVTPMASGTYVSGYALPGASNSFTLDGSGGTVTWDKPLWICVYIFDIRISEWRNIGGTYYLVGKTMEEVWAEVQPFAGLEENNSSLSLTVFPNPSQGLLNFTVENPVEGEKYEVKISNSLGQLIKTVDLNKGSEQVNEGDLASGIYFYSLFSDGKIQTTGKIVITGK